MATPEVPANLLDELQGLALRVATGAAELLQTYSDVHLEHVNTKRPPPTWYPRPTGRPRRT